MGKVANIPRLQLDEPRRSSGRKDNGSQPLTLRLFNRLPISAPLAGVIMLTGTVSVLTLGEWLSGRLGQVLRGDPPAVIGCEWLIGDYRIGLLGALLLAYVTTARVLLANTTRHHASRLNSCNAIDMDTRASRHWWGFLPGCCGIFLTLLVAVDIAERPIEWTRDYWILPHAFNWAWCVPFGWMTGRFLFALIGNELLIARLTLAVRLVSVFDTRNLDAATAHSKHSAVVCMVFLGCVSVHFLDPGAGLVAFGVLFLLFAIGTAMSNLALIAAARVIGCTKHRALGRLLSQLQQAEAELVRQGNSQHSIDQLLAMEKRIIDSGLGATRGSNIVRLALYAAVGLLSWLGAAAVEMGLEAFLA